MRIAYITSSAVPARTANSVQIANMCSALAGAGHEVTLVAPRFGAPAEVGTDLFEFYGLPRNFRFHAVRLPRIRGMTEVYALAAVLGHGRRADLMYARSVEAAFFGSLLAVPTMYEAHAPVEAYRARKQWMLRRVTRSRATRQIVVISPYLKDNYLANRATRPIIVAPDGATVGQTVGQAELGEPSRTRGMMLSVGYAGSLYSGRGVEMLVTLARHCPWAEFRIIGGPDRIANDWRLKTEGLSNIAFLGSVNPSQVPLFLAQCDVLMAPYEERVFTAGDQMETSRWMSPLKVFEYMAARRPIVASRLPALEEVLVHERTALLCAPGDAGAWVAALSRLRDDPTLRCELAANGRTLLENEYGWDVRVKRILAQRRSDGT